MSCPILLQRVDVYTQVNDICMQNTIKGADGAEKKKRWIKDERIREEIA